MKFLRIRRPSASVLLASLALLVALSGTSVASIANVPLLSVGTPQIKPNAVTSPKVANRSLLAIDFRKGQLPRGARGLRGLPGPQGPSGPPGPAGVASAGYVAQVTSQASGSATTTSSTSYVDLAGSTETVVVPAGETARIYAVFSAESVCYGGGVGRLCGVRILVDGNELNPAVGNDFAFDSNNNGGEGSTSWESHAIARTSETLGAGNHTVKVQIRTSNAATALRIDDWALVLFRTKVS
ncbi:MAG TPA: hypothetical protein VFR32_04665 [Gaiellaceae bacterium]|nr:hypothetical protein [Gaiellaceae bacterium]